MTNHNELLKLIETVDHEDQGACDELNARFWCFLYTSDHIAVESDGYHVVRDKGGNYARMVIPYTHSLDALKAVQDAELKGWGVILANHDPDKLSEFVCILADGDKDHIESPHLPTMQLAWMHALVQAIAWKRENEVK